jgi:hypothetical protein
MEEETIEILSRYLDNDLDNDEAARLEDRFRADPELAAELVALQALQRDIASIAAREQPPSELDQLVEPLLLGRPTPIHVRPWARWLATAAAIVLGITVVFEVNRSRLGDRAGDRLERRTAASNPQPTERFSLAPLPTSSLPEDEQPLGATDRILASPIPEVVADDPPAFEVLGPLEKKTESIGDEDRGRTTAERSVAAFAEAGTEKDRPEAQGVAKDAIAEEKSMPRGSGEKEIESGELGDEGNRLVPAPWEDEAAGSRGHLYVFMDGETAWQNFETETRCQSGRYVVRIRVNNEVVRDVWPVGIPPAAPSQRLCAAEIIVGLKIENVSDGEYPAEVVVERRGVRN